MACRRILLGFVQQSKADHVSHFKLDHFVSSMKLHSTAVTDCIALQGSTPISRCPFHGAGQPTAKVSAPPTELKKYGEIPTPKALPIVGTTLDVIRSGGAQKIHEYCDQRHKQLGAIYRERLGAVEAVFVADGEMIQSVYQNEGKYPMHMVPEPWTLYNQETGIQRGLFFMDGPLWSERRKSLSKVLLRPQSVKQYSNVFNDVITDLLKRWQDIRTSDNVLCHLEKELYNWSIESLGMIILGRRLGCVTARENESNIHEFVNCVQEIFTQSAKMTMIPPKLAYTLNLPVWRKFAKAAGRALELGNPFEIAKEYVEETVRDREARINEHGMTGGIIDHLLVKENISAGEIIRIVTDLFLAAADTTSHTTQWTFYLLAKNPQYQQRILEEVSEIVPPGELPNENHLSQLPYVRAVIKEALRLYPVAPFLTRILPHKITLGKYEIPAGKLILMSLYTTGRDPKNFADPETFKPERWMRKKGTREIINTHACLPFGLGVRSCIGRQVAETQMQLLVARIVQQYNLSVANKNEVGMRMRMITTPSEPVLLRMTERTT